MSDSKLFYDDTKDNKSIYGYIERIRNGDVKLKDKLIKDYLPFIGKSVSKVSKKYEDIRYSDIFSIGMIAFNEALDNYDENKGKNFFAYCDMIIRSRIIDYYRKSEKEEKAYPFTYFENEDEINFEEKYLRSNSFNQYENIETQDEMEFFQKKLSEFNINIYDIGEEIPKHRDSIIMCIKIAKELCDNDYLYGKLIRNKSIPLKELVSMVQVHKRTIERNRKFIIVVSLIFKTEFTYSKEYIQDFFNGSNV
ncbi:RNA polymerase sigma-I factor [Clostridium beijerinckii]|uniref:RNA polymerase sigma factor SigI n=1 Tax=Clostridium beijerinckii TaxID=1520 RepID=A0A9Q5CR95_CLOBE|nr:RNA polymerase sigma-I factor [Clostridium beijerinckii]AQS05578.1 RNA polymerase sigma factor SigI [Clostridium beijerinckii]MBA2884913.1 RNA polymerase sigma factor [Clostridium beijerinckii]MBA2899714.1 RNA polymerase sigma factor [Clostridium beijerinckii]MBA2909264.1 RNA polymerase sigma factor [Clostridium beijerinckii]MBA9014836.1 RNA polymerase sigma factor [Clostridium beijerinckii]